LAATGDSSSGEDVAVNAGWLLGTNEGLAGLSVLISCRRLLGEVPVRVVEGPDRPLPFDPTVAAGGSIY
jgi:hypothetical protein